jgi:uncharacterized protein (TIGR02246 family)
MKKKLLAMSVLLFVALFAVAAKAARSGDDARDNDKQAIRTLMAEMMADWNKHDMKSFMSHFTEDSDAVTRVGQWIKGRAKHEEHLVELHASPFRDELAGRTSKVEAIRFIRPDVAVVHEIAEEKIGRSIRTYALSKKDGQWKVESDTISMIGGLGNGRPPRADDGAGSPPKGDASAILDKAIAALGGEQRLSKIKAATWKTKGTISLGGNDNEASTQVTMQGLDHFRQEFDGGFGGKGILLLDGDKAWRTFGEQVMALDKQGVADLKRTAYLAVIPITILPLKTKEFKVEALAEEKTDRKPLACIKVTDSDGKEFSLYFDEDSGLPVKHVAKVAGFGGAGEVTQEMTFSDYKQMDGIMKAMRIQAKRNGEKFFAQQLTGFRILEWVDPKVFAGPK